MTCIVGLVDEDKVWIGGDSAGVAGYDLNIRADEKVFVKDKFVYGFTGSFRMGQLLHYSFVAPDRKVNQDLYEYMVVDFVDAIRACYKAHGWGQTEQQYRDGVVGAEIGGTFLVGTEGRLFSIQSDFQVGETKDSFQAVGCGDNFAKGSLYTTRNYLMTPKERIEKALQAAEHLSTGVQGPFVIRKV